MDIFGLLELIGGLALFLFGMSLMGTGLEKSTGNKLKGLLERLTSKKLNGLLLGMGVTAIIQSSSATTVMVVGFVNSGVMTLKQAIHVIMGSNIGTTVTAWVLSLTGIKGDGLLINLMKPASFTPILALIGIIYYMFIKNERKKDIGLILLGFATLIYGMEAMSAAVKPLGEVEGFRNILLIFSNPILGMLAGAILTGIIQSSSASVGILQALSATGQITMGTAIPIIMGQNIGTCVTALISSIGANKNARRAALVHLYFNIIGSIVFVFLFIVSNALFDI
ncbi:MAG: Na/Pi symporter, partial [Oscillospiraceae bacterium]|nr:Na/Pi symporter [Oscillospiraceae bacterium]